MVLRRRADHRRSADVDVLDRVFQRHAGLGDGLGERVQVDDNQIDRRDVVLDDGRHVLGLVAVGQNPAVDARVEGLDAPFQHLGEIGDVADADDRDARVCQRLRRSARADDLYAPSAERLGELDQPRLVRNAHQRPPYHDLFHNRNSDLSRCREAIRAAISRRQYSLRVSRASTSVSGKREDNPASGMSGR